MNTQAVPGVTRSAFGVLPDGSEVELVTLQAPDGLEARIMTYGASLQALLVPDIAGRRDDIVLGHDAFEGYLALRRFFGATVGRYANRIAGARFTLDDTDVQLVSNNGPNALHGGLEGFDRRNWRIVAIEDGDRPAVTLTYTSAGTRARWMWR
jgi:aldose 1-epimerase